MPNVELKSAPLLARPGLMMEWTPPLFIAIVGIAGLHGWGSDVFNERSPT